MSRNSSAKVVKNFLDAMSKGTLGDEYLDPKIEYVSLKAYHQTDAANENAMIQGRSMMSELETIERSNTSDNDLIVLLLADAQRVLSSDPREADNRIAGAVRLLVKTTGASQRGHTVDTSPGSLAPWQVRRAKEMIEHNLEEQLSNAVIASTVRLSLSHFTRAFKKSVGVSPHVYICRRRLARAKLLMATTAEPLSQIALSCGFADQSHFTRLFKCQEGEPPNAWRRQLGEPRTRASNSLEARQALVA